MFEINEIIGFIIRSDHAVNMADMQDSDLTNLKLQKLLYYIQGHSLAEFGKPMFNDQFLAWQHGPVIKEIYHEFKHNGSDLIGFEIGKQKKYDCTDLSKDKSSLELVEKVVNYYNQYSPWKLRNMTHEEEPWKNVKMSDIISQESMKEFFSRNSIRQRIL